MAMVEDIVRFWQENSLIDPHDRIVVGVSGGVDSMVMIDLMRLSSMNPIAIAHCNFSLRGAESDQDQSLVEQYATKHGLELHCIKFDTKAIAAQRGQSIQVTARDLRYDFFENLCQAHGYTKMAVAHHLDDSSETLLINTIRGTGLRGLCGIPVKRGKIIRPLMFTTRNQIMQYATQHKVRYRDDSTNSSTKYLRNFLRHKVLPLMQQCAPEQDINHRIAHNQRNLSMAQSFIDHCMDRVRQECMESETMTIDIEKLRQWGDIEFTLHELLSNLGFNATTTQEMARTIKSSLQEGKQFSGSKYMALVDRGKIFVNPLKETGNAQQQLHITHYNNLTLKEIKSSDNNTAHLCSELLTEPLVLRKWQKGDWFCPLGMNGQRKLISDFLIDKKLNLIQKEHQTVVVEQSTGNIVWVVGLRPDHRYRVTDPTNVVAITIKNEQQ